MNTPSFAAFIFALAVGFHIRQIDRFQRLLANGPSPAITLFLDVEIGPLYPRFRQMRNQAGHFMEMGASRKIDQRAFGGLWET